MAQWLILRAEIKAPAQRSLIKKPIKCSAAPRSKILGSALITILQVVGCNSGSYLAPSRSSVASSLAFALFSLRRVARVLRRGFPAIRRRIQTAHRMALIQEPMFGYSDVDVSPLWIGKSVEYS